MAGPKAKFEITGVREYLERLKQAGADIDKAVAEAVHESAKPIEEDIRVWAEKHKRTGAVLEGVDLSRSQADGDLIYVTVGIDGDKTPTSWHAAFVEYGTPRMAADPGIQTAFKVNKAKVKRIQRAVLKKGGIPVD